MEPTTFVAAFHDSARQGGRAAKIRTGGDEVNNTRSWCDACETATQRFATVARVRLLAQLMSATGLGRSSTNFGAGHMADITRTILVLLSFGGVPLLAQDPDSALLRSLTQPLPQWLLPVWS